MSKPTPEHVCKMCERLYATDTLPPSYWCDRGGELIPCHERRENDEIWGICPDYVPIAGGHE